MTTTGEKLSYEYSNAKSVKKILWLSSFLLILNLLKVASGHSVSLVSSGIIILLLSMAFALKLKEKNSRSTSIILNAEACILPESAFKNGLMIYFKDITSIEPYNIAGGLQVKHTSGKFFVFKKAFQRSELFQEFQEALKNRVDAAKA